MLIYEDAWFVPQQQNSWEFIWVCDNDCLPECMSLGQFDFMWFVGSSVVYLVIIGWFSVFFQALVGFLWFVWLSVSLCGHGFGLFASKCGFYVYVNVWWGYSAG